MVDPLTMLIGKMLIQAIFANPPTTGTTPTQVPNTVPVESIGEIGEGVLHCYHPSGKFRAVDVIQSSWGRGHQYKAPTLH
jgi:hypothetical protein